jgi:hypothetical protein
MKTATTTHSGGGRNYNKIIMTLFVVVILLFGLLAGLYVVNQRVTVENRASEPQISPTMGEPYIECKWKAEAGVDYTYRITEKNIESDETSVLPEGTISLGDGASSGADGVETSSSDDSLSVIYRNVKSGSQYTCEVYVGGPNWCYVHVLK